MAPLRDRHLSMAYSTDFVASLRLKCQWLRSVVVFFKMTMMCDTMDGNHGN
jgi:hypothetical protein